MKIYNNTTKKWEFYDKEHCYGYVILNSDYFEHGYFTLSVDSILVEHDGKIMWLCNYKDCHIDLYYRNDIGAYSTNSYHANNLKRISKSNWPYPIQKYYNFSKLNLQKPEIYVNSDFTKMKFDFTVGLEYETNRGNIPWLECVKHGLVPLYDGSITGHEYVTFPLQFGELGIVEQHLTMLSNYTTYDKNCSLHVHFGNFPISYNDIQRLVEMWKTFQFELLKYLPPWSYEVENYKDNEKAYNKPLVITDLKEFYAITTGNHYDGEECFYYCNRYDCDEVRKWEVRGRYYNMNIMHLISGSAHKTVEFRFLRPTKNYLEVKWYILILSAFLQTVINSKESKVITIPELIDIVYDDSIKSWLHNYGNKLYALHKMQITNDDAPGIDDNLKNIVLNEILPNNR